MPAPPSRLVIHPGPALSGAVSPPGDKSITHRAYLLGGLAEGESVIEGGNPGADCESTLACLETLGVVVRREPGRVTIEGRAMRFSKPDRLLDCGNSGTTLRLLSGPLAAQPFHSTLAGDASLNRRPVDRVIEPLRLMGAKLSAKDGDRVPPLEIDGGPLRPIEYVVASQSAQVASCVLLAGLYASGRTTVFIRGARDHTERMLPAFGVPVHWHKAETWSGIEGWPRSVTGPASLQGAAVHVPRDFSAAAFFLAAAAAIPGASVTARGVSLNPTRTALLEMLRRMGATIEQEEVGTTAGEPVGNITVKGPDALAALDPPEQEAQRLMPSMIDEVPTLAMVAARARGVSHIRAAAELRVKETDRLAALAKGLRAVGVEVEESSDGLAIHGGVVRGGEVDARGDHRIAMAFAILGTMAAAPITIRGAREIATSYPGFVTDLRALGAEVEALEEDALAR